VIRRIVTDWPTAHHRQSYLPDQPTSGLLTIRYNHAVGWRKDEFLSLGGIFKETLAASSK